MCLLSTSSILSLTCILELIEQQTRPSFRFRLNPNDCIPRLRRPQRNTPIRRGSIYKSMMEAHMFYLSSSRPPLLRNTVSERSRVSVVSSLGCNLTVPGHLPRMGRHPRCPTRTTSAGHFSRLRQRKLETCQPKISVRGAGGEGRRVLLRQ